MLDDWCCFFATNSAPSTNNEMELESGKSVNKKKEEVEWCGVVHSGWNSWSYRE